MVLSLQESPEDFAYFLRALYGFCFSLNGNTFAVVSALLRLSTKYGVDTLRKEALHGLALSWPSTLLLWELREKNATNSDGLYAPRPALPHPILVIKLAREANAPELLPSAFYDLSRYLPSQLASGYTASDGAVHHLPMEDLFRVLRGKEHAARFLSTFIVNELEGRTPSQWCLNRNELEHARKHACQIAFEAINFELIRDVNGMVCNRNTDPLFCIADSFLMQTREDLPGVENKAVHRACEACRMDYGAVVDAVREDFWRKIPECGCCKAVEILMSTYTVDDSEESSQHLSLDFDDEDVDMKLAIDSERNSQDLFTKIIQTDTLGIADVVEEVEVSEEDSDDEQNETRMESVERLESVVFSFLMQLSESLQKRKPRPTVSTRTMRFPQGSKAASAKPFAQLFRVVDLMHEALLDNIPTTKRDMYYKEAALFKSQGVVDRLVDDLAATLQLGRADLHVRASSKGLICGSGLTIHLHDGAIIHVNDSEGALIPLSEDIARFELDDGLAWVLIVEKEAVFQTLCRLKLASNWPQASHGLIITGYPDIATRQLIKTLSDNLPAQIPILALVDGDAYGIDILSVYKYGSLSLQHEREQLAASRVRWLGLWASELAELGIEKDALLLITKHDEKKALSMLRRSELPKKWRKELQYMLHTRRKAEIEILSTLNQAGQHQTNDIGSHSDLHNHNTRQIQETCSNSPLLQYLVNKISACTAAYRENP
ncbi:Meiotic recombination protein SPO11 [Grifola frondosa]|uniref:DNA topoisomerase (ATP-hydrolyzing) n=1 Tax=Grifola frondosa TaxID=5627 RepID=A0A1C7LTN7_GRIFR|nr:Meiotic recombination protein SPO11 [Grifola frondosa]